MLAMGKARWPVRFGRSTHASLNFARGRRSSFCLSLPLVVSPFQLILTPAEGRAPRDHLTSWSLVRFQGVLAARKSRWNSLEETGDSAMVMEGIAVWGISGVIILVRAVKFRQLQRGDATSDLAKSGRFGDLGGRDKTV